MEFDMEEDVRLFLNHLAKEKKCSKNTLDAYHNDLIQLVQYIKTLPDSSIPAISQGELSEEHLSAYMLNVKDKGYASSTVARKVAAARSFLKYMSERGKASKELGPKLSAPKVNKGLPKALSVAEVQRLLAESARLPTDDAKRDRAMLEMLYGTGMLASELMSLNIDDFDMANNRIKVTNQRGKARTIAIERKVADILRDYANSARMKFLASDREKALFLNQRGERLTRQGFWQIVQSYADSAGIAAKVTPRTIRHSYAVHKLNSGADLQSVQEVLGHAHISTTRVYKQV
jgi:integrase/recombinase XerD